MRASIALLAALTLHGPVVRAQDCIPEAAKFHGVNEAVLRAIAWHESRMNPSAVGRNSNGTVDIGRMQTNSVHLQELAQYGITPSTCWMPACLTTLAPGCMHERSRSTATHGPQLGHITQKRQFFETPTPGASTTSCTVKTAVQAVDK